jgi:hypothetical protein
VAEFVRPAQLPAPFPNQLESVFRCVTRAFSNPHTGADRATEELVGRLRETGLFRWLSVRVVSCDGQSWTYEYGPPPADEGRVLVGGKAQWGGASVSIDAVVPHPAGDEASLLADVIAQQVLLFAGLKSPRNIIWDPSFVFDGPQRRRYAL